MPGRIKRSYRRYREGSSAFKVDFAIEGDIPWTNPDCARAGTVHLGKGGTFAEIAGHRTSTRTRQDGATAIRACRTAVSRRSIPQRGQYQPRYGRTPTCRVRLHRGCHRRRRRPDRALRPSDSATASSRRSATSAAELQAYNPNYIGGDIVGGANDRLQVIFRPRIAVNPYAIGVPGVYLCSQSTPPGPGIHGLCGYQPPRPQRCCGGSAPSVGHRPPGWLSHKGSIYALYPHAVAPPPRGARGFPQRAKGGKSPGLLPAQQPLLLLI